MVQFFKIVFNGSADDSSYCLLILHFQCLPHRSSNARFQTFGLPLSFPRSPPVKTPTVTFDYYGIINPTQRTSHRDNLPSTGNTTSSPGPSPRSHGGSEKPLAKAAKNGSKNSLEFCHVNTMKCLCFVWTTVSDCRKQTGLPNASNNFRKNHFIMCHVTKYSTILGVFQQFSSLGQGFFFDPPFWVRKRPWGRGCRGQGKAGTMQSVRWEGCWVDLNENGGIGRGQYKEGLSPSFNKVVPKS